jgi:CBS domain containing-hemolysin-like protein
MIKLVAILLALNFAFAVFLYSWATDDDISNLPKDPKERFSALLYFTVTTSTSTGYGDIVPKSIRARMASSVLQLVMLVLIVKRILEKN